VAAPRSRAGTAIRWWSKPATSGPTTQPWTGETQYLRSNEAIFEDACHEGNYSLQHILEGGRVRDGTLR